MLLERGDPGDHDTAEELLDEAISIYSALGLTHWAGAARQLLDGESEQVAQVPEANVFRRKDDLWLLRFDGEEAQVKDAKGMGDIARVLANPGQEIHVLDLLADTVASGGRDAQVDGHEQGRTAARSDERARATYRHRLSELEEEIEKAEMLGDAERSSRAQVERQAILAQLTASYGIARRPRPTEPIERARATVTSRIRSALTRIERVHPTLGRHLSDSIRLGTFCSYSPERAASWAVQ